MENDSIQKDIERQLHEQYAINNNSKSSGLISLIGTFLIALTGYGYAIKEYLQCDDMFNLLMLAIVTAQGVLAFLYIVSVYLGSDQRMEQFIVNRIRESNMGEAKMKDLFPAGYSPFGKSIFNFVQGIYGLLSSFFMVFMFFLPCSFIYITNQNELSVVPVAISFVLIVFCLLYKSIRFLKYSKRCEEFKNK